jgi:hypothetical protein
MQIGGRDERMDAPLGGRLDRPGGLLEVFTVAASQAGDDRTAQLRRNAPHGFGIGRGRNGESGLDDVDPERIELTGKQQLFSRPERKSGRLLAVSQRRVEYPNVVLPHETPPASPQATVRLRQARTCAVASPGAEHVGWAVMSVDATLRDNVKMIIILLES